MDITMPTKKGGWTGNTAMPTELVIEETVEGVPALPLSELISNYTVLIEQTTTYYKYVKDKRVNDALILLLSANQSLNSII